MANMANITVLDVNSDNVVYTAATPSSGDNTPAVWRANALSPIIGYRPKFEVILRDNQKKTGRVFRSTYKFPITGLDANSQPILLATVPLELSGTLPTNVDASVVQNAFIQFGNLIVSALVRSSVAEGYAPT